MARAYFCCALVLANNDFFSLDCFCIGYFSKHISDRRWADNTDYKLIARHVPGPFDVISKLINEGSLNAVFLCAFHRSPKRAQKEQGKKKRYNYFGFHL